VVYIVVFTSHNYSNLLILSQTYSLLLRQPFINRKNRQSTMLSSILFVLALAAAVSAKTIPIEVGKGGINFKPNSTTADVGDV
jgi:hypothetical protein